MSEKTEPRILTSYAPDAKPGDVYERHGEQWQLVEQRVPRDGDNWISHDRLAPVAWGAVWRDYAGGTSSRWIVTRYVPVETAAPRETADNKPCETTVLLDSLTRIVAVADRLKETLVAKHRDYGGSVYKQPRFVPGVTARQALLIRLGDKIERLQNLLNGAVANVDESIELTLLDTAGYALLLIAEKDGAPCPTT